MANENEVMTSNAMIECENLVKIYKTKDIEVLALQGLELEIARGVVITVDKTSLYADVASQTPKA